MLRYIEKSLCKTFTGVYKYTLYNNITLHYKNMEKKFRIRKVTNIGRHQTSKEASEKNILTWSLYQSTESRNKRLYKYNLEESHRIIL